ncbi:hypothetical protein LMG28688_01295 [Paraburkholderia caffeinitolerans]|uniref:Uncharacterized protein n=1 Tax=Paraburkholderia caffeinitolerans TaxID=1723730 RepID=A0A6J5FP14_9BURK|nr:hypothetical protein LMG28688_01295 [Paraburkholderia caffeinitolerans]CAB3802115.1 hypothetical protein LMG28690_05498 [Paraburkholderia caffeinilytica]
MPGQRRIVFGDIVYSTGANVLKQRASLSNVQQLHTTADPEDRHLHFDGAAQKGNLEFIRIWIDSVRADTFHALTILCRIDIGSAKNYQPVV